MAEIDNTIQNQEPTYLNYGNDQIDQQAFLDAAANNVQQYLSNQPWSNKRKQRFLNAYSDIISKGIIGANNTTGQWAVDINSSINLDAMNKKDQEMYHEAAYYILQQMKGITPKKKEEEQKKENLTKYDFTTHNNGVQNYIGTKLFGGRDWNIGGANDDWNILDERDTSTGLRGVSVRANKLANMLQGYSDSLEEGKYDFEGSPYESLADLKGRISNAVTNLRRGVMDQNTKDALNQIGLDWRDYFNDGSGDIAGVDAQGNQITYAQLAQTKQQQEQLVEQQNAARAEQERKANLGVLSMLSGIHGTDAKNTPQAYAEYLASEQGLNATGQQAFNLMNQRVQALIEKGYNNGRGNGLTQGEKKQLGNFLYYIRQNNPNYQKSNLSDQDWVELSTHKNLGSTDRSKFVRLPWQTSDGRYTYADDQGNVYFLKPSNKAKIAAPTFQRSTAYNNYKNNFLFNTKAGNGAAQKAYLNQEGAEIAEIGAIIADIASIVDPELFSAMGLSLVAAGARNYAKLQQPGKWSLGDYASQGLDYLTSVIGAVPIVGDAVLAEKVIKNLRRLGRFGAWSDIVQSTPGLVDIWNNKIMGDQKMTKQDWRTIGTALRGLVSHGRLNQSNLAARTVMQQRGLETGNAWHQRTGFTSSTPKETSTPTLKVTKNGKSEEIDITAKEKQDLKEAFKKAKPSERTEKAREILGKDRVPEGTEVKVSEGLHSTARNWNRFTRRTSDSFGTKSTPATRTTTRSDEEFENFLKGRSTWNKIGLGTNRYLRRIDRQLNLNSNSIPSAQKEAIKQELKAPPRKPYNKPTTNNQEVIPESRRLPQPGGEHKGTRVDVQRTGNSSTKNISTGDAVREFTDFDRMYITSTRKNSKVPSKAFENGYGSSKEPESGSLSFNDMTATVTKLDGGRGFALAFGKTDDTVMNIPYKNIQELRSNLAQQLNKVIKKQNNVKETAILLRQFKAKGWLKHGGTIDKQRIQRYKEYINK